MTWIVSRPDDSGCGLRMGVVPTCMGQGHIDLDIFNTEDAENHGGPRRFLGLATRLPPGSALVALNVRLDAEPDLRLRGLQRVPVNGGSIDHWSRPVDWALCAKRSIALLFSVHLCGFFVLRTSR
jgi:hypothetical protein